MSTDNLELKARGSATPLDPTSLPGFIPGSKTGVDLNKFRVRYLKLSMEELADISELERIETRAIHNNGIYVMSRKEFTFMDKIFILIQYLEKIEE